MLVASALVALAVLWALAAVAALAAIVAIAQLDGGGRFYPTYVRRVGRLYKPEEHMGQHAAMITRYWFRFSRWWWGRCVGIVWGGGMVWGGGVVVRGVTRDRWCGEPFAPLRKAGGCGGVGGGVVGGVVRGALRGDGVVFERCSYPVAP